MIKRIFQISDLLLITLAVYLIVSVFYRFMEIRLYDVDPAVTSAGPAEHAEIKQNYPLSSYSTINDRNLFKTTNKDSEEKWSPIEDVTQLELTDLDLKLWGTISASDRKSGIARAVIEQSKIKRQGLYKVGDTVENAKITEIFRNSVVLDINGRKEKLTLAGKAPGQNIGITTGTDDSLPITEVESGQKVSLKRAHVDDAFKNINKLMSEVKIGPYFQDDKPVGFIVESIAPESVVREMGLKTGDIITSINGRQIKTADDAMSFYNSLKAGDTLKIQITRRGRPQTIEYAVEDQMLDGQ